MKPTTKKSDVERLNDYDYSPYAKTYNTILGQIVSFNEQIEANNLDLYADKGDKSFDRCWKYLKEAYELHEQLDKFRSKMTPQEIKESERNIPLAERLVKDGRGR